MLKRVGLPMLVLLAALLLFSTRPAQAATRFGVYVGPSYPAYVAPAPVYAYPYGYPYAYPYGYNYYGYGYGYRSYSYPYYRPLGGFGFSWGGHDGYYHRDYDHGRWHGGHDSGHREHR